MGTVKQVEFMESWGNGRAAQYFEAELPSNFVRPREGDSVRATEKFIRDKYEHRKYCRREIPPPTEYETQQVDEPVNRRRSKATPSSSNRPSNGPSNVAAAPVKAPVKEEPNLLDFVDDTPSFHKMPQGAPSQTPPQQQVQQFSSGFDQFQSGGAGFDQFQSGGAGFDQFQSGGAPGMNPAQSQLPSDNGLLQPAAPPPPKASANDILSMFNQTAHGPMGGMMNNQAPMGGMMNNQAPMGGMMNMGMPDTLGQPMNNMRQMQGGFPPQSMQQPPPNMNMQGGPMQHQQMGMGASGQPRPPQMNNPNGQLMMPQGMPPQQMGGMPQQMGGMPQQMGGMPQQM